MFRGAPSVAERYLEAVRSLGVRDDGGRLEVFCSPADETRAAEVLGPLTGRTGLFVGIAPSARHFTKVWLPERFARAGADLAKRHNAGLLLFGSPGEAERCNTIERLIRELAPAVPVANLAGALTLTETAAVLDRCAVVLTNDSGLMHLAAARARPVVAVFGSTVREFGFFPFRTPVRVLERVDLRCRPCTHIGLASCPRGHFRCMNDIPASAAVDAAEQLLLAA
jgi:heptosyltransferase-2